MAEKTRKAPGVDITELEAFPRSIVGAETAVPAFIGYTEKAVKYGKLIWNKPTRIGSLADYSEIFGDSYEPKYKIEKVDDPEKADFSVRVKDGDPPYNYYTVSQVGATKFYLFNSLRFFYENGGGKCYIVAVDSYENGATIDKGKLIAGLNIIKDVDWPTMLLVPDALLLSDINNYKAVVREMLKQSNTEQDRVAVLDVFDGYAFEDKAGNKTIEQFRENVGPDYLSYGMSYFPWLNTTVVQESEIDFTNFDKDSDPKVSDVLKIEAKNLYTGDKLTQVETLIDKIDSDPPPQTPEEILTINQDVMAAVPLLLDIENIVRQDMNILPSSGAMAGIYTRTDSDRGVWKAPVNTAMNAVISPTVEITDDQQADMNGPLDGKAVNAIREFAGQGTLVWGARTLDGNSNDYRYINVRRTLIYIEQSIKIAIRRFVFEPNDGNTWAQVKSMIDGFLTTTWEQGGLMGDKASDAFEVSVGLGSTMTAKDVLEGYMIVQVLLQMLRPAEFIELVFKQKMQGM